MKHSLHPDLQEATNRAREAKHVPFMETKWPYILVGLGVFILINFLRVI